MAAQTQAALTKQLYTELAHKQWLARNLHGTKQQRASLVRILKLRTAQVRHNACVKEKERTPKDALSLFITNR
jgi:hypothetical protein